MELPRRIVVGHDALEDVGKVSKSLRIGEKSIIVVDETTKKVAGERVGEVLKAESISSDFFSISEATRTAVEELEKMLRNDGIDFVLGVGGGRPIDVAKCASFGCGIPFISACRRRLPTTDWSLRRPPSRTRTGSPRSGPKRR
jgi:glycerol-1-phosphate dehydrogenase [NAD(P)+]